MLVYTTDPLEKPMTLCGPVRLRLFAASTAEDTDFACRLLLLKDGEARQLQANLIRARYRHGREPELIEPGSIVEYDLLVGNVGVEVPSGGALRIEVMSSLVPVAARHANTAETIGQETAYIPATQTVYHDIAHPSCLLLPVLAEEIEG